MRNDISGSLDVDATATLSRLGDQRMRNFVTLSRQEQANAIVRLAGQGMCEQTIARATGLAVEQIYRVLAEAAQAAAYQERQK